MFLTRKSKPQHILADNYFIRCMVCLQHYLQGNMIRRGPGCGMYSSRQSCTPDINSCGIVRGAMQEWICEGYAGVEL